MNEKTKPTEEAGEVAEIIALLSTMPPISELDKKAAALLTSLQKEKEELERRRLFWENSYEVAQRRAEAAERELAAVREAFTDMFALIDEGWLVRNTAHDHREGWAMRQVSALQRLAKAKAALQQDTKEKP